MRRRSIYVLALMVCASVLHAGDAAVAIPFSERLHAEARTIHSTLKSTEYSHKTKVDEKAGSYAVDCSGFICVLLKKLSQPHYKDVPKGKHARPLAVDFHEFFAALPNQPVKGARWQRVARIADCRPGDLIAWRRAELEAGENTGHIVIVDESPVQETDGQYRIAIVDSTATPHARDSRKEGATGIGRGTMWFTVNADGQPIAYRWRSSSGTLRTEAISTGRALDD